uniref:Uncharacterized protein n=1 Tax=Arundo donax TaxID=35708 RepID=A0A0A9FLS3_ARUDO
MLSFHDYVVNHCMCSFVYA